MATAKRSTAKGKTSKAPKQSSRAKATAKKAATNDGPTKRELQRQANAELRERVVELREADTSWGEIATELSITPGKAQFLHMQHEVEENPRLRIKHRNEDELVAGIRKAREAEDRHSSWGWIAARTGVSEGKIKALAEEAGMPVRGANIAVSRAEANGNGKKSDAKTRKQATTKAKATPAKKGGTAKATAARKRAAKKAGKAGATA